MTTGRGKESREVVLAICFLPTFSNFGVSGAIQQQQQQQQQQRQQQQQQIGV